MIAAALLATVTLANIDVTPNDVLIDEPVAIVVRGVVPGSRVTIDLRGPHSSSSATFVADASGVVDVAHTAPVRGDYAGLDPMGLFWSTHRDAPSRTQIERDLDATMPRPEVWRLTASVDGSVVGTTSLTRRAVAADVRMTAVRDRGLRGVFYEPPTPGPHPAIIVLSGSGGGVTPASSFPGGLGSRGYAVLSLAYFGAEGLPSRLHDIPLEYFGTALDWLIAQPSVDRDRIGILGISRGAELSLLLASVFPQIRTVVAYVPANVVVGGCCTGRNESSWTIGGHPLAWAFPKRSDFAEMQRAAIKVEQIKGAVLLISGAEDRVWPSSEMSNAVMARLERSHFAYPHLHFEYAGAGHGIGRPYVSTMDINNVVHPLTKRPLPLGGSPVETAQARADSWRQVLAFLDANLRHRA